MRVFSAYGEGLRKQLFWDVYQKSKKNSVIELFGTGEETRDFIHIEDILIAIECIIEKSSFEADVVNVATGVAQTVKETASTFAAVINPKLKVHFNGISKQGDPIHLQADVSKLFLYGFKMSVTLQQGIADYCKWAELQSIND